jgi:succinate dehydrogenase / fumarate reductase iron-sulfur subunit
MTQNLSLKLRVWRQKDSNDQGKLVSYEMKDVSPAFSFLELLDLLNEQIIVEGGEPIEFDSDCREGICGTCGLVINGVAHGPKPGLTTCAVRMRDFKDGETITIEPFRAKAFPVIKDLVVDRSAFDRIIQKGGYISTNAGSAPEANSMPIGKEKADRAMDSAACIGCGACVAACPNASASLFVSAKITQLALLPQGQAERGKRAMAMVEQMDAEGFGACSNHGECEAVCPKRISILNISTMRREFARGHVLKNNVTQVHGEG